MTGKGRRAYDRLIPNHDPCHWVRDEDGFEVLIPRCWGSVLDPAGCTCDVEGSRLEQAERGRVSAEAEIMRLREKLERQADRYAASMRYQQRLWAELRRLRAEVESLAGPEC
ncbi:MULTISPECIES: hypothetical protein [Paracoccus]|uniref:hypothetical protein n=1 Tax=Paracoccus TaxID=265 RepID=UPI001FB82979|nr:MULTISPECIES: hypothetical protein [Paracoccus]MCJ1903074.1 hypothetical protein [Paracoccus versutus]MDF3907532.1 hypothetical protein [Paracoccus sp. AS002]